MKSHGLSWSQGIAVSAARLGPLIVLAVVFLSFALVDWQRSDGGTFLTVHNLRTILVQTVPVAVAALGMTMVIISGGIDLSAGTALSLSATVLALMLKLEYSPVMAVCGCILTGGLAGMSNGLLVSSLRVVPFIVTLGTMTCFLGIGNILADSTSVQPSNVPEWLQATVRPIPQPSWLFVSSGVWATLMCAALLSLALKRTVFGRHLFALGSNEATARLCGINIAGMKIAVYTLAGLFVGLAGVFQVARTSVGNPTSGRGIELDVIAAVVIGGGSLSGGRGSVIGTLTGAAVMPVIRNGCTHLGISNPWQDIALGTIIIAAVTLDQLRQRRLSVI